MLADSSPQMETVVVRPELVDLREFLFRFMVGGGGGDEKIYIKKLIK